MASTAGLVDAGRVLWGFALRTYLPQPVDLPVIACWEPTPWRAFPGYGWVFPGAQDVANVGLGLATRSDRRAGADALRSSPPLLDYLHALGLLADASSPTAPPDLGGWLKMGMVGTTPTAGERVAAAVTRVGAILTVRTPTAR